MYELSSKISLDKINPRYPFHPQTRVRIDQESRLSLRPEDLKQFSTQIGKEHGKIEITHSGFLLEFAGLLEFAAMEPASV